MFSLQFDFLYNRKASKIIITLQQMFFYNLIKNITRRQQEQDYYNFTINVFLQFANN